MQSIAQSTVLISLCATGARLFSVVTQIVIAKYIGASQAYDNFLVAQSIPEVLPALLIGPLSVALLPLLSSVEQKEGYAATRRFAGTVYALAGIGLGVCTVLVLLFPGAVIRIIGYGFSPGNQQLSRGMLIWMAPGVLLLGLGLLTQYIFLQQKHVLTGGLARLTRAVVYFACVMTLVNSQGIRALVGGFLLAYFGYFGIMCGVLLWKRSVDFSRFWQVEPDKLKVLILRTVPAFWSSSILRLNTIITRAIASGLRAGSVSVLNYAMLLSTQPTLLYSLPLSNAFFPRLASAGQKNDIPRLHQLLLKGLRVSWFVMIPVMAAYIFWGRVIIDILFGRGEFTQADVLATSQVLTYLSLGIFGQAGNLMVIRSYYSLGDTVTPAVITVGTIIPGIWGMVVLSHIMGVSGIALAISLFAVGRFLIAWGWLTRRTGSAGVGTVLWDITKITAFAALGAGAGWLIYSCGKGIALSFGTLGQLGLLMIMAITATGLYFALSWYFHIDEARQIVTSIRHWQQRRTRGTAEK